MEYLITFRCCGTWLHGDERGAVHHRRNAFGAPLLEPHRGLQRAEKKQMKQEPILLDAAMRAVVEAAIHEVVTHRGWQLHALAVRTNHVHAVVSANDEPEKVLHDFKAYPTRRLREAALVSAKAQLWSRHGSTRYLWDDPSLAAACRYGAESQGEIE